MHDRVLIGIETVETLDSQKVYRIRFFYYFSHRRTLAEWSDGGFATLEPDESIPEYIEAVHQYVGSSR